MEKLGSQKILKLFNDSINQRPLESSSRHCIHLLLTSLPKDGLANVCSSSSNASRAFSGKILFPALNCVPSLGDGIGFSNIKKETNQSEVLADHDHTVNALATFNSEI